MSGFPGVVKTDEKTGRYIEASRDIKAGELIITEEALVVGPSGDPAPHKICLGCYKVITGEPVDCSVCKWPMCSDKCEKVRIIHDIFIALLRIMALGHLFTNAEFQLCQSVFRK